MVNRERSSYVLPYQKQAHTRLSLRLIPISKLIKIFTLFIIIIVFIFITLLSLYAHVERTSTQPIYEFIDLGQVNSTEDNILVIVDGEKQGLSLQPIFCQLSTHKNVNTHVIVTGQKRSLSKKILTDLINRQDPSCKVIIYDLNIQKDDEFDVLE